MEYQRVLRQKLRDGQVSPFTLSALELLDRLEYRPVRTGEDLEDIFRFRYRCYRHHGHVDENPEHMSKDHLDDDPYVMRFGVFLDGDMVSSIRIQHLTREKRIGPSMVAFSDMLDPMLDQGITMIDPSRFTIDPAISREYPALPYLTVRLAVMATIHFQTDRCLALIRPLHAAFYKRVFRFKQMGEAREWPGVNFPVSLYSSDPAESWEVFFARYPFFRSLPHERRMLFGKPTTLAIDEKPLSVLPTAPFAMRAA